MLTIIVPVLNEAMIVHAALRELLCQQGAYEVLVVDGGSDDGTRELVASLPVTLIQRPPHLPRGTGVQLNLGTQQATGDAVLFLHADVRLPQGAIALVERALADPRVVGGGFLPSFEGERPGVTRLTLGVVERVWQARTRRFRWFAGDQAPFVRRAALLAAGGYPTPPLAEDWAFAGRLSRLGRLVTIERPVRVSARRHVSNGVLKTLLVTGSVELMYHLGVDAHFLRWWYRRWLPRERAPRPEPASRPT